MTIPALPNTLSQKRIPTILGLVILVVALVAGVFFIGKGPGVFAPRATPETTPKNVKVTNVTDTGFTVSFLTDAKTAGFVKYGTEDGKFKSQASDDRDQLSGSVGEYQLHHITIRGLEENTNYFYIIGTGNGATFDNNGRAFSVKTARRAGPPAAAKTVYGSVTNTIGGPAEGSIVYVSNTKAGEMSSLVKNSGSWAVPLSNARVPDGSAYAQITDEDTLSILVQGNSPTLQSSIDVKVAESQPVATITLGGANPVSQPNLTPEPNPTETSEAVSLDPALTITGSGQPDAINTTGWDEAVNDNSSTTASGSGALANLMDADVATSSAVVDLEKDDEEEQVVETTKPVIVGKVAPNTPIRIVVRSDNEIETELITDQNGRFELD